MKKYYASLCILLGTFSFFELAFAEDWQPVQKVDSRTNTAIIQSFQQVAHVPMQNIVVPTVFEADFDPAYVYSNSFGVFDETGQTFTPYFLMNKDQSHSLISFAVETPSGRVLTNLFDDAQASMSDFYLNNSGLGGTHINIDFIQAIQSDSLNLILDNFVSLPSVVTLKAIVNNSEVVVVNRIKPYSSRINFPRTTAQKWILEMEYSQPLRISEIQLNNGFETKTKKSVRFLALPGHLYTLYTNQEVSRLNYGNTMESPDLYSAENIKKVGLLSVADNPAFVLSDSDKDSIPDIRDNCVSVANPLQEDIDGNGRGDACDDFDRDGIINSIDNCKDVANMSQIDTDGDKIGDACDADESRLTEKYPALVWFGIGSASLVFMALLFIAGKKIRDNNMLPPQTPQV